jgi:protein ATS1
LNSLNTLQSFWRQYKIRTMTATYALGSNGSGQLGIGHKEDVSVPKDVQFRNEPKAIDQLKAGGNHTLLLSSGVLYCSGDPSNGACGLISGSSASDVEFRPLRLSTEDDLSKAHTILCAASWEASIIVQQDKDGRASQVYSFGTGNKGELGQGEHIFRSSKAQKINNFPPENLEVVDLAASVSHVVVVLNNGDVYGWGSGRKGQIGQPEGIISIPRKIQGVPFKVVRAVCGREFTYLLGQSGSGQHAVLGSDKWNVKSSIPDKAPEWKDIGATWGSIFVLQQDAKLISWGRDDHGQLTPPGLPPLSQIAIGSEHVVGLATMGDVLAWGWGEHGNCGPNTTNGDVKGRWNVIASSQYLPPGSKITSVGAGCATSWISITS